MSADGVGQLEPLAALFAIALGKARPASVAILGIAGGNGLSAIDPNFTRRTCGIDLNPSYLKAVAARYPKFPGLELHCVDLATERLTIRPVELVHVALVFEHAGTGLCLENAVGMVESGGSLSVILQLPSETAQAVSATPFTSLAILKPDFQFVEPEWLTASLGTSGVSLEHEAVIPVPSGKAFWHGIYRHTSS